jgi:hypothetical protein
LGLNIHEGTASMAGCRISGSTSMAIRCYGTSMIDLRGEASCRSSGIPTVSSRPIPMPDGRDVMPTTIRPLARTVLR